MTWTLPTWLNLQQLYIVGSAVVAVLIWIESVMLSRNDGKPPKSAFFHISSLIDTIWFVVSMSVLYFLDLPSLVKTIPIIYGLYSVFGWIYSVSLIRREGIPDSPDDLVIPKPYITYSQSFAPVFFLFCLAVLVKPFLLP